MALTAPGMRHQRTERHAPWQNGRIELNPPLPAH
jgi:hypothetical protein